MGSAARRLHDEVAASDQGQRPLGAYASLAGVYAGAVAAATAVAVLTGRRPPERVGLADVALLGVGTHKAARLLAKDRVTGWLRAPFTHYEGAQTAAEVHEEPRGRGPREAVGHLVTCPFCLGQWVATAAVGGLVFAPRATRLGAAGLAVLTISDFLQYAYAAVQQKVEG